ncbi:MAG TPA: hypothetical protein HA368_01790 [Nanoarchaeota archaeon]|nr:hypothetical protein [Nanoarchaeota archaeon]
MKKKIYIFLMIAFLLILFYVEFLFYENYITQTIKIANWNLNVFGESKAGNNDLMTLYKEKISNYDIIFIQEIRDISGLAFYELCSSLENYSCVNSSRAGRTNYKEQYGVIFRDDINLVSFKDYNPDSLNRWERPPVRLDFKINDSEFIVYNIHVKPDDVSKELGDLEDIVEDSGNVIILGDFNADCSYYNEKNKNVFNSMSWVIKDYQDTAVSKSRCAYDRIVLNDNSYKFYKKSGVDYTQITENVSDHYIVWVEMKI